MSTPQRALARIAVAAVAGLASLCSAFAQTTIVPGSVPKVLVDVAHCAGSGSTLCSGSGSVGPAADGNASIVAVYYHGVTAGLTESNFSLSSVTNRAPGVTPQFVGAVTCAACFAEVQPGVYRLAARPSSGNWGGGTYVVVLTVTRPNGASTSVMVPIDIPY